jgi:hypothetical protein
MPEKLFVRFGMILSSSPEIRKLLFLMVSWVGGYCHRYKATN